MLLTKVGTYKKDIEVFQYRLFNRRVPMANINCLQEQLQTSNGYTRCLENFPSPTHAGNAQWVFSTVRVRGALGAC